MTTREVKAYLRQYRGSIDRTRETTEHLDELKAEAIRLKDHEGQKVALDDAVQKYVDACNDAAVYLDMLSDLRRKIESEIESISEPKLQTVLRMRYISGKTFEQIAVDMNKSWRHTVRLHGAAILEIKKILECH